jgi:hypothetical protein
MIQVLQSEYENLLQRKFFIYDLILRVYFIEVAIQIIYVKLDRAPVHKERNNLKISVA